MKGLFIKLCVICVILTIIIPLNYGEAINPYNTEYDDQYTYDYFNNILDDVSEAMTNLVLNNESCINQSGDIYNNVKLTRNEILLYNSKGIHSSSIYFIDSFYNLSKNLVKLCELNGEFHNNLEMNTTESLYNARINAMEINDTLLSMEHSLDEIDNISILKKGNETLRFNTSNIRELIKFYNKGISGISINIANTTNANLTSSIIIHISNENPILFENVKIYGIGNSGSLEVHTDNETYNITVLNNTFAISYKFNNTGIHKIYATQNNKSSNIIYANVLKIPVNILVDSKVETYVNNNIAINGKVVDYYGNFVNGTIYVNNLPVKLINGTFTVSEYSPVECVKNIPIVYAGDKIHSPSNKTVEIIFKKYPTTITIDADKYNATVGDTIQIYGNIYGLNETSKIYVFVNNASYPIYTKDKFSINISPNSSGAYSVYALYNGSDIYSSSKSNTVVIHIEDGFNPYNYALIAIILMLLIATYLYRTKYKNKTDSSEDKTVQIIDESAKNEISNKINNKNNNGAIENQYNNIPVKIPSEISKAYNVLFDTIIKKYGLSRDTTPRELLNYIKNKNPNIFDDLKYITDIHEKNTYGNIAITSSEKEKFFKIIGKLTNIFINSETAYNEDNTINH